MFDQSYSVKNLIKIYHEENKKGVNLAGMYFPDVINEYEKIKRVRRLIRKLYLNKRIYRKNFDSRLLFLYRLKDSHKKLKNEKIKASLEEVSRNIGAKSFDFKITKFPYSKEGKDVYVSSGDANSFFAEKQIQKNIKKTYSVKPADRDLIVPQLKSLLNDKFPKIIIKTDVASFFESIDREILLKELNRDPVLSLSTRKLVAKVLRDYETLSGCPKGIPRGLGVSSYLSELYLKDFDRKILAMDGVVYYSRYVDDIVVILSPRNGKDGGDFLEEISGFSEKENLYLREDKTEVIDDIYSDKEYSFDYLGYKFTRKLSGLSLGISDKKRDKYRLRINKVIDSYMKCSAKQPNKAKKELYMRLRFLTSNTRLSNNKGNAMTGVYYANKWLDDLDPLNDLDNFLKGNILKVNNEKVINRVSSFSFLRGFREKEFSRFYSNDFRVIVRPWAL